MQTQNTSLVDRFDRIHDYLRISLTERCNLRCFYCMPPEGILIRPRAEFMRTEEVIEIAKVFVSMGVKKIRLTGGEPLIRRDTKNILRGLSKLPVELAITTNGILVDEYVGLFNDCDIKSVNVSLDSLQKIKFNTIARRDYFEKVSSNIELLLSNNFYVKVNAVIIKGVNDDEICDFVSWTREKNVQVRFIEFMPFEGNRWDIGNCVSQEDMMARIEEKFGGDIIKIANGENDTARNYKISGHQGTFAIISSVTNPFCGSCNRMRLTADGKMKNCLFSTGETDLLSAFRKGENIAPLILKNILGKKKLRGGIEKTSDFGKQKNRTMVSIGG